MYRLYASPTPNGIKVSACLEALNLPYDVIAIDLSAKMQKDDWFLRLNPNGRIPVLVDTKEDDFALFESGAILLYLAEKTGRLIPSDVKGRSRVIQWLMFQMAGIGPMQGQANVFNRYAPERIAYAMERYSKETRRLYQVLDAQLVDNEYIAGDYSIADLATWPWCRIHEWSMIDIDDLVHLNRWLEVMNNKAECIKGVEVLEEASGGGKDDDEKKQSGSSILI